MPNLSYNNLYLELNKNGIPRNQYVEYTGSDYIHVLSGLVESDRPNDFMGGSGEQIIDNFTLAAFNSAGWITESWSAKDKNGHKFTVLLETVGDNLKFICKIDDEEVSIDVPSNRTEGAFFLCYDGTDYYVNQYYTPRVYTNTSQYYKTDGLGGFIDRYCDHEQIGLSEFYTTFDTTRDNFSYGNITPSNKGQFNYHGTYFSYTTPIGFVRFSEFAGSTKITNDLDIPKEYTPDEPTNNDPYAGGGTSGTGGGGGNYDDDSDPVDIPALPSISVADAGFITIFSPNLAQMKNLAAYMWSDLFSLDTFKKIFANPIDAILGLSIVPVPVPDGGLKEVKVGNIPTGINLTKAAQQWVEIDCGTINIPEYWGAYLDYSPYTKLSIVLPYCGAFTLDADDIIGQDVRLVYHVDILTGACAAYLKCGQSVLYNFTGQCSLTVPITGSDFTQVVQGAITIAATLLAPEMGAAAAAGTGAEVATASALATTAGTVISSKPSVRRSGSLSGVGGILGIQQPYIILHRPAQCLPSNQNQFTGYPSYITRNIGALRGYTEILNVHLENISATKSELQEIESLLKGGVIL